MKHITFNMNMNAEIAESNKTSNDCNYPTLEIKKLKMVAKWKYSAENDVCRLCNKDLTLGTVKKRSVNSNVEIGDCRHGIHTECLNNWLEEGNISCPICKTPWNISTTVMSGAYIYEQMMPSIT